MSTIMIVVDTAERREETRSYPGQHGHPLALRCELDLPLFKHPGQSIEALRVPDQPPPKPERDRLPCFVIVCAAEPTCEAIQRKEGERVGGECLRGEGGRRRTGNEKWSPSLLLRKPKAVPRCPRVSCNWNAGPACSD